MSLTADQLASILDSMGDGGSPKPGDARRAPRVKVQGMVQFSLMRPGQKDGNQSSPNLQGKVVNLSARGLCMQYSEALQVGQQFVLHLPQGFRKAANVLCTVLHCEAAGTGRYTIGAEFTCSVSRALDLPVNDKQLERIRSSILG